jgi:hypothetical protein
MDHFVFLFPDTKHVNTLWKPCGKQVREINSKLFNACIDKRYRKNGYKINFVLFKHSHLSNFFHYEKSDAIIKANISARRMVGLYENGEDYHIEADKIISQLKPSPINRLVVGGYTLTDCVDRFAEDTYNLGLDVLVDEDLTDVFLRMKHSGNFKVDNYPSYNPMSLGSHLCMRYLENRKDKPWLWQFYF